MRGEKELKETRKKRSEKEEGEEPTLLDASR